MSDYKNVSCTKNPPPPARQLLLVRMRKIMVMMMIMLVMMMMMMMITAMTNDDGDDANDLIYKSAGWTPTACAVRANHCVQLTSSNQPTPKWYPWWWRLETDVFLLKLTNRHHYFYDLANIWNLSAESISCNNVTGQKSKCANISKNFLRTVFALM